MNYKLTSSETEKLTSYIARELWKVDFLPPEETSKELAFTANQVVPHLNRIINSVRKKGLYVRGEGTQPVRTIHTAGMQYKPDAAIEFYNHSIIAFEVKLIRSGDPSGSFSKAIGQALAYLGLGKYETVFVLLFDTRKRAPLRRENTPSLIENLVPNLKIYVW